MITTRKAICALAMFVLLPAAEALANSAGPIPRVTAGFREGTCLRCHGSFRLNEGRTKGGVFEIRGVPKSYNPGQEYPVTVVIGQPGQSRWGFELSARFVGPGTQAGTLAPADQATQVKEEAGIQYIQHTSYGTQEGSADGPAEFHFVWKAPDAPAGAVFFNAAGNAADASRTPAGDYIYTAGAYSGSASGTGNIALAASRAGESRGVERVNEASRLADLPTPVDLNKGSAEVLIQHRFFQSISDSTPGDAFGIDYGANINLGVNYALTDRLSAGIGRARLDQLVGLSGTFEIRTREDSPWKMSVSGGVEGKQNFENQYSPFLQLTSSVDYKALRLLAVPTVVFNSRDDALVRANPSLAIDGGDNHTFSLGLGADVALGPRLSLVGEVVPRLAGFGGFRSRRPQFGGGLMIRTAGHVFNILVSTSRDFGPSKYAVNAENSDVSFGFNIYRRIR